MKKYQKIFFEKKIEIALVLTGLIVGSVVGFSIVKFNVLKAFSQEEVIPAEEEKIVKKIISMEPVKKVPFEFYFTTFTTVQGIKEVTLIPEGKMTVRKIFVKSGDFVKKGDLIAQLDSEASTLKQKISDLDFKLKESDYQVNKALAEKEYVAKNEFKQKEIEYEVEKARRTLASIEGSGLEMRATISGVVGELKLREGDYIDDQSKFYVKIVDQNAYKFQTYIPHDTSLKLKLNGDVKIYNGTKFVPGVVRSISPIVDPGTGTVLVEAESYEKGQLVIGSYAKINFVLEKKPESILVRSDCILNKKKDYFVFVVDIDEENKTKTVWKKNVELGAEHEGMREIISGVEEGDHIVFEGQNNLKDGDEVEVFAL